ncbi:diguanylate cyclase [bacterium]|nr:diguanylate cyclase [bacterium]
MENKISFSGKLAVFIILLVTIIVGVLSFLFFKYLIYSVKDSFFGVSSGVAYYILKSHDISGAIANNTIKRIEKKISADLELQEEILYVALISSEGEVIMDTTGGDVEKIYREDKKHEWIVKGDKSHSFFLRKVELRNKVFDIANISLPIYYKGKVWGVGVVGIAATYFFKEALPRATVFILILFVVFLSSAVISLIILVHYLFRPVRKLIEGAEGIFEQNFDTEIPVYGNDEIGQLAMTFNRLISYLKDFISRLQEQCMLDPLTNCYRESFFHRQLNIELERSQRFQDPICIGWFEIYDFSSLVDKYGQIIEEKTIKTFSDILKKATRHIDVLAHIKNHRFGLILPKTNYDGAMVVVGRLRDLAAGISLTDELGKPLGPLQFSYGMSCYAAEKNAAKPEPETVLKQADEALRQSQSSGPNQGMIMDLNF